MSHQEERPVFGIGSVARMTDIPEATLRVWERRYPFPRSARTSGGHRLYSQQDVLRLQWVKARIDEGMQVSQAIRALQRAEQQGEGLSPAAGASDRSAEAGNGVSLHALQRRVFAALLEHNLEESDVALGEALALYPVERIVLELIGPALQDIGELWAAGQIDVATEHLASNHLRRRLLAWINIGPPPYAVEPVVLACAPGELHEGSLLMLAVLLRRLRWPVAYLGQTMPLSDLPAFVEDIKPSILVFVAMAEETAQALADWPRWLVDLSGRRHPSVVYGGRAFVEHPELVQLVPGTYLGDTVQEGLQTLDRMLHELHPTLR